MKKTLLFLVGFLWLNLCNSQVVSNFYPDGNASDQIEFSEEVNKFDQTLTLPSFDFEKLKQEDLKNSDVLKPYRFGKDFDTNVSLTNGTWKEVSNGRIWSMSFRSTNAYSLNFVFSNFKLAEGAKLYIINENETMSYGPVTSEMNPKKGDFLTDLVEGDFVTIYLFEPLAQEGKSTLTIKKTVHAYKNVLPMFTTRLGESLGCNNDINCFPAWDFESDAVGLVLLANGTAWCSGSLLMTADQSFDPYFLSAFHCIDTNSNGALSANEINNAENWMFRFQYKKAVCNGNTATLGTSYNGATFRAGWDDSDMALVELDTSPIGNTDVSYLGWDRRANTPTRGTTIHHPRGDVMKISFDNNALQSNANVINWAGGTTSPVNSHWTAILDNGTAEGGSSGSMILNQNRRVVGQLHGGFSGCAPVTKHYGRFDVSWTGGGTDATRLSNWLDPCGSTVTTTNSTRPPSISGSDLICSSGASYTVNNLPAGATINWTSPSYITRVSSQGSNPCTFSSTSSSSGWIQATITPPNGCGNTIVVRKNVKVGAAIVDYISFSNTADSGDYFCSSHTGNAYTIVNGNIPNTTYQYRLLKYPNLNVVYTSPSGQSNTGTVSYTPSPGWYVFDVRTTNPCGTGRWSGYEVEYVDCSQGGGGGEGGEWRYHISPNPTSETLTIGRQTRGTNHENVPSSYELYNFHGNLITKGNVSDITTIDVSSYKKGSYILKITSNSTSETHHIIVH